MTTARPSTRSRRRSCDPSGGRIATRQRMRPSAPSVRHVPARHETAQCLRELAGSHMSRPTPAWSGGPALCTDAGVAEEPRLERNRGVTRRSSSCVPRAMQVPRPRARSGRADAKPDLARARSCRPGRRSSASLPVARARTQTARCRPTRRHRQAARSQCHAKRPLWLKVRLVAALGDCATGSATGTSSGRRTQFIARACSQTNCS